MSHLADTSGEALTTAALALRAADSIPAMVAYWNRDETCVFANDAYGAWFGRSRESLIGTKLRDLLGPIYELNFPFVRAALAGSVQVFERRIPKPDGSGMRDSFATYTPHIVDGEVLGFYVHVADITMLKQKERELERALAERDRALAESRALRAVLPVCAGCRRIHDEHAGWLTFEAYAERHVGAQALCPACNERLEQEIR